MSVPPGLVRLAPETSPQFEDGDVVLVSGIYTERAAWLTVTACDPPHYDLKDETNGHEWRLSLDGPPSVVQRHHHPCGDRWGDERSVDVLFNPNT